MRGTGPLALVDLETTGLPDDGTAEPIELAALLLDPDGRTARVLEARIRPRHPLPRAVRALTGLCDADLADAPGIRELAPRLAAELAGRTLVAHNAGFERHFLGRFVSPALARASYLDTQDAFALCHPDAPDLRLETFARELLGRTQRHRALDDVLDTARLLARAADGARAGAPRYVAARRALETFAPDSAWLALLAGGDERLPLPDGGDVPAQFVPIPLCAQGPEKPGPFDPDAIAAALADAERGARHFPGYRVREEQIRMAREFARLLDQGGRLLLEGGTGVGKSLAYLAAAIPFAMERAAGGIPEPVLVSTRTKLLQDQLLGKDIPAAAAMLGYPELRALSMKGRANYACARRCEQVLAEGREPRLLAEDRLAYAALATCAATRPHGELGTLPGALLVRFPLLRDLRRRAVASRAEQCTRDQCATERQCAFGRRRAALAKAHLVVANHDLLLRWPPDYPAFTHAIADEAHELVTVADEVYATEVRPELVLERFEELFGRPDRGPRGQAATRGRVAADAGDTRRWREALREDLVALGRILSERAGDFGTFQLPARARDWLPEAAELADHAAARLESLAETADTLAAREEEDVAELVERSSDALRAAAEALRSAFGAASDEVVAGFEGLDPPFDRWRLALRQVAPAAAFHEGFLSRLESFTCVSASLFVGGEGEDAFASLGELEIEGFGEGPPPRKVRVESPFPYADHMAVVALRGSGEIVERTSEALAELARLLDGRTLGLFTSLRRMREARERLVEALSPDGYEVLAPRRATDDPTNLVQRFRRCGGGSVLLGSRTFWQGVDIPGDALQAVVIEKLPFEVPTELRRRREERLRAAGGDPFERYTLGKMLLNLKQMVGRLIRSEEDRGLVVIVDGRTDRRYFSRLREALPGGCDIAIGRREDLRDVLAELSVR